MITTRAPVGANKGQRILGRWAPAGQQNLKLSIDHYGDAIAMKISP